MQYHVAPRNWLCLNFVWTWVGGKTLQIFLQHPFSAGFCWAVILPCTGLPSPPLLQGAHPAISPLFLCTALWSPEPSDGSELGLLYTPALLLPVCEPEHLSCPLNLSSHGHEIGDGNRTYFMEQL